MDDLFELRKYFQQPYYQQCLEKLSTLTSSSYTDSLRVPPNVQTVRVGKKLIQLEDFPPLFTYQKREVDNLKEISDENWWFLESSLPGVGKTNMICSLLRERPYKHVIVVAPKSSQSNWASKVKWGIPFSKVLTPESLTFQNHGLLDILPTDPEQRDSITRRLPKMSAGMADPKITFPDLDPSDPQNKYDVSELFARMVEEGLGLVVDECHKFKNESARQQALTILCRYIRHVFETSERKNPSRVFLISSTPMDKPLIQVPTFLYTIALIHAPIELKPCYRNEKGNLVKSKSKSGASYPGVLQLKQFAFQFCKQSRLIKDEEERTKLLARFGSFGTTTTKSSITTPSLPPPPKPHRERDSFSSFTSSISSLLPRSTMMASGNSLFLSHASNLTLNEPSFLHPISFSLSQTNATNFNLEEKQDHTPKDRYPISPQTAQSTTMALFYDFIHRFYFGCTDLQGKLMDIATLADSAPYFVKFDLRLRAFRSFMQLPEKDELLYILTLSKLSYQVAHTHDFEWQESEDVEEEGLGRKRKKVKVNKKMIAPKKEETKEEVFEENFLLNLDNEDDDLKQLAESNLNQKQEEKRKCLILILMSLEYAKLRAIVQETLEYLLRIPRSKVVIMVNYEASAQYLFHALKTILPDQVCLFTGQTKGPDRARYIETFQSPDLRLRVIVGNLSATNQSIDLHDTHGDFPRLLLMVPCFRLIDMFQGQFRVFRAGNESDQQIKHCYVYVPKDKFKDAISKCKSKHDEEEFHFADMLDEIIMDPDMEEIKKKASPKNDFTFDSSKYVTPAVRTFIDESLKEKDIFPPQEEYENIIRNRTACREDKLMNTLYKKSKDIQQVSRIYNELMPLPDKYLFLLPKESVQKEEVLKQTMEEWKIWGEQIRSIFADPTSCLQYELKPYNGPIPIPPSLKVIFAHLRAIDKELDFSSRCPIESSLWFDDNNLSEDKRLKFYSSIGETIIEAEKSM